MSGTVRKYPPSKFAKKCDNMPEKRKQVENALTNLFGNRKSIDQSQKKIDTYYIHEQRVYYQGQWHNQYPHGSGKCLYQNGSYYQGRFDMGQLEDDNALFIFPNGATYRGPFKKSQMNGKDGVLEQMINQKKYQYKGQWKNGKPEGTGVQMIQGKVVYSGPFVNGQRNCFDEVTSHQQKLKRPPKGITYNTQTQSYTGQFKNGVFHGYGTLKNLKTGAVYQGFFQNGKKKQDHDIRTEKGRYGKMENGVGQFIWNDGRIYRGHFNKDNKFDGIGKIIYNDQKGQTKYAFEGQWKDGHCIKLNRIQKKAIV